MNLPTDVELADLRLTAVALIEAAARGKSERIPALIDLVPPGDDRVALTAVTAQLAAILVPVVGESEAVIAWLRAAVSGTEHPGVTAPEDGVA